jgi:hypothetical protein
LHLSSKPKPAKGSRREERPFCSVNAPDQPSAGRFPCTHHFGTASKMSEKSLHLPKSCVKRIMKVNTEVNSISAVSMLYLALKSVIVFRSRLSQSRKSQNYFFANSLHVHNKMQQQTTERSLNWMISSQRSQVILDSLNF